ncbi:hypothetical protein EHI8A_004670 [Entamoeba histolytica HM-1:IMSS-B]|uniref:Uncharacterized protein n=6 Tax=Entamoeba histolytica TaxID=5759 RepID=C4M3L6_ENTH1|nr:hypothetical protein EHI_109980 [Entamoeba histolytica HM-1:IMSS]EMD42518.1 Hypothetical protein EHI5A_019210 [Entamoeba histolytica KU27]EMH73815.1 hypothetical protein EHI8A_004670 [Entamoeba histolytica HM-1:IMSS-B]EMS17125.1 hypothetical protein KM1_012970 [Entamoeba histolytica HM-3:IMSS]ENY64585.1 hypothetical protein EHI7A_069990 [Entamoeba histolytica HM-1:IMSS-A]GAT95917.1 hypothetical protein CL6EHI_109980 [Entamoeba histolytica]|eukprot:XP_652197.1 hypothetical protein EHI_109980 [Entamoeba histolytica HM-1:IMSS]
MNIIKLLEQQIGNYVKHFQEKRIRQVGTKFVQKRRIGDGAGGCDSCGFINDGVFYGKGKQLSIIDNGRVEQYEVGSSVRQCIKTDDGVVVVLNERIEFKGIFEYIIDGLFECIATDGMVILVGNVKGLFCFNRNNHSLDIVRYGHYLSVVVDKSRKKVFGLKERCVDIFNIKEMVVLFERSISLPQIGLSVNYAEYPMLFGVTLDNGERRVYFDNGSNDSITFYQMVDYPNSSWCFGLCSLQYTIEDDKFAISIGNMGIKEGQIIEEVDPTIKLNQPVDVQCQIKKNFIGNEIILKVITINEIVELTWTCSSLFLPQQYLSYLTTQQPIQNEVITLFNSEVNVIQTTINLLFHILPNLHLSMNVLINYPPEDIKRIYESFEIILNALNLYESHCIVVQEMSEQKLIQLKQELILFIQRISEALHLISNYSLLVDPRLLQQDIMEITLDKVITDSSSIEKIQEMNNNIMSTTNNFKLIPSFSSCGIYFNLIKCIENEFEYVSNLSWNVQKKIFIELIQLSDEIGKLIIHLFIQNNKIQECSSIIHCCDNNELSEYMNKEVLNCSYNSFWNFYKVPVQQLQYQIPIDNVQQLQNNINELGNEKNEMSLHERERLVFEYLFQLQEIKSQIKNNKLWTELQQSLIEIGNRISLQKDLIKAGVIDESSSKYLMSSTYLNYVKNHK